METVPGPDAVILKVPVASALKLVKTKIYVTSDRRITVNPKLRPPELSSSLTRILYWG
jgi:hypothetical protein